MNPNRLMLLAGATLMLAGSYLATTGDADAHERRHVDSYTMVVGFLNEPALLNEPNAVDLRVFRTSDEAPIEGLENTLDVEVTAQGQSMMVDLSPRFRTPGAYNGYFMPTAEGTYTFHFLGTIEGVQVNESFTSGPGTFSEVNAPIAFPNPLGANAGTETQAEVEQRIVALENDSSNSGTAMAVGIAGIIVGALGLAVGGMALMRSNKA